MKEQNPDSNSSQVMSKLAALWKQADAEEKSPFEKEASALKEKYMADIKAFKSGPQAKFIAENPGCDKKPGVIQRRGR